jgi:aldehyde:ferredoxin oxidoreductase
MLINLGISDLDHLAHLIRMCNDYGVDAIEVGAASGCYRGQPSMFGDADRGRIDQEIGGTHLGESGGAAIGKVLEYRGCQQSRDRRWRLTNLGNQG